MELYIGGYAQGKLTYVRKKYPGAQIYDENSWQQTKSGMCTERVQALSVMRSEMVSSRLKRRSGITGR